MSKPLSCLLPYDLSGKTEKSLRSGLQEYRFLLEAFFHALENYNKADWEQFDGLVGENACQIRALWIAVFAKTMTLNGQQRQEQIRTLQQKIDTLLKTSIQKLMLNGVSLDQVLEQETLDLSMTEEEMFLLQTFLLMITKGQKDCSLCSLKAAIPKNMKKFGDVSTNFTQDLLNRLRRSIAKGSVIFLQKCAEMLQNPHLITMTSETYVLEHNQLSCLPMYWSYRILLDLGKQLDIPIVLHAKFVANSDLQTVIEEETLFYKYSSQTQKWEIQEASMDQAAIMVQGICVRGDNTPSKLQWKLLIEECSLEDIILAGAADHRQYPNAELDAILEPIQDMNFLKHKAMALKEGFALTNPSLFFIQHVYPTQINKVSQLKESAVC